MEPFTNAATIVLLPRCNPIETTQFLTCIETNGTGIVTGDEILEAANLSHPFWLDVVMLCAMLIVFRAAGYIGLRLLQKPRAAKRH